MPLVYLFIGWTCVVSCVVLLTICGFLVWQSRQFAIGIAPGFFGHIIGMILWPIANWLVVIHVNAQRAFFAKTGPRVNAVLWYLIIVLNLMMAVELKIWLAKS
jgi:hypothetical protein